MQTRNLLGNDANCSGCQFSNQGSLLTWKLGTHRVKGALKQAERALHQSLRTTPAADMSVERQMRHTIVTTASTQQP